MELDFTAVAVDIDAKASPKDIGCYVHMDGELLDVITPIRDKIGMENILTVTVSERPKTIKLIVKRMGDLEELLGSASVPLSVFASLPASDFQRLWVKLSLDPDSDLFIPSPNDEVERPRVQLAYRTKFHREAELLSDSPLVAESDSPEKLQQLVWELEAELEVTKTELRFEQEKGRQNSAESLKRAEERIRELESQLKSAVNSQPAPPLSPKPDNSKYSDLLSQYKSFVSSQKAKDQATEARMKELVDENCALKSDLAAKQHHISTLVNEITYLKQSLILQQVEKSMSPETSELSEVTEEIAELQQRLGALQSENAKLRKDVEGVTHPKTETVKTPKSAETKVISPKKPPTDTVEASLNALLPKFGFSKVSRVVEGIYLLNNRRIHAKMQGGVLLTQLGGSADWQPAEDLFTRLKEEGEAKSVRRSISVGQESDIKPSSEDNVTPKKTRPEEEQKTKPTASKIMRDFSPILKKKK